jgi:hypothetical protein
MDVILLAEVTILADIWVLKKQFANKSFGACSLRDFAANVQELTIYRRFAT